MLTSRRSCCQKASFLILVVILGSCVLLWVQQRRPEFLVNWHAKKASGVEEGMELYVPKFTSEITDRDYENNREKELSDEALASTDLDHVEYNLNTQQNNGLSISEFESKQPQEEQNHTIAVEEVYHVTEENSLIEYSNKNDVHHNDSTIKQQPEQQNHIDVFAKTSRSQLVRHFPKYVIIGFGKAGTKALFEALKLHPSLSGPRTERRFFSRYYSKGLSSYLVHMPEPPPGGYTIEKSPDYITQPVVPRRILKTAKMINIDSSSLKFIVVLRNPIDRAVSEYLEWNVQHKLHHKPLLPSFSKMVLTATGKVDSSIAFLNTSCYAQHIRNWLQVFDKEQMCFVDGDRFISDPYEEVYTLEQCMKLRPFFSRDNFVFDSRRGFYCFVGSRRICMNASKGRKHPDIPKQTIMKLKVFFHTWNMQLLNLTGREFTSWGDT